MRYRVNMDIKRLLKKNRFIYDLNASIKAAKTRKVSKKLLRYYERKASELRISYDRSLVPQLVKERLAKRGIAVKNAPRGQLKIFWVGASKEQDYSGFIQGLESYGEVKQFVNRKGLYGQEFSSKVYDPAIVTANSVQLLNQVEAVFKEGKRIDVLIGQMWANFISMEALKQIQNMGVVTLNVSMDDRLPELWGTYDNTLLGSVGLADGLDLVLTSCPDCCVRYHIHDCPAIFWPMASNPELFKPAPKKDIDVCFVGNNYGNRGNIIRKLQASGIHVDAYGAGWPNGYIGPDKIAEVFGRAKIILGIGTIAYNRDIFTLKLRDFDAVMAGALYLTHRNPDLLDIFTEGKQIECYSSEDEAISKIFFYLKHPEMREQIAASAASAARKFHTWEIRLGEAFSVAGFLKE
jgi:spore maturation protein CgeB